MSNGAQKHTLLRRPRPAKPILIQKFKHNYDISENDDDVSSLSSSTTRELFGPESHTACNTPELINATPPPTCAVDVLNKMSSSTMNSREMKIVSTKSEKRYILDSELVSRRSTARVGKKLTLSESSMMQRSKYRGPDPLQPRDPKKDHLFNLKLLREDDDIRYSRPPLFTLNNFIIRLSETTNIPMETVRNAMLSTANYKKITEVVARCLHAHEEQTQLNYVDVDLDALEEIEESKSRIPSHQILLEMAAIIKQRIAESMHTDVTCVIKHLPNFDPRFKIGEAPHTEIVVYEKKQPKSKETNPLAQFKIKNEHTTKEALYSASGARAFQGGKRSSSPFAIDNEEQVSPSEVAVLDAIMSGGVALSLKANFIHQLPDIVSLIHTVTYVNLSYNNFTELPSELFYISQLQVLKMRNNPIMRIPLEINQLVYLKTLILSFGLIEYVPLTLYELTNLRDLDLSYNKIAFLDNKIEQMRHLRSLNVEGNELTAFPCGILRLHLKRLRVKNNFLHPLLWKENMQNHPQTLLDICATSFHKFGLMKHYAIRPDLSRELPTLSETAEEILTNWEVCDCCKGPRFGSGLPLIRPAKKRFRVRMLPIMFVACSPSCRQDFLDNDEKVISIIYDDNSDRENNK